MRCLNDTGRRATASPVPSVFCPATHAQQLVALANIVGTVFVKIHFYKSLECRVLVQNCSEMMIHHHDLSGLYSRDLHVTQSAVSGSCVACGCRCVWAQRRIRSMRIRPVRTRFARAVPPRRPFEKASASSTSQGR